MSMNAIRRRLLLGGGDAPPTPGIAMLTRKVTSSRATVATSSYLETTQNPPYASAVGHGALQPYPVQHLLRVWFAIGGGRMSNRRASSSIGTCWVPRVSVISRRTPRHWGTGPVPSPSRLVYCRGSDGPVQVVRSTRPLHEHVVNHGIV